MRRAAVVSDARGGEYFDQMSRVLDELAQASINYRVLFLDASDQELLTRYQETRRRHPLSPAGSVPQGVAAERELVNPIKARADLVVDRLVTRQLVRLGEEEQRRADYLAEKQAEWDELVNPAPGLLDRLKGIFK